VRFGRRVRDQSGRPAPGDAARYGGTYGWLHCSVQLHWPTWYCAEWAKKQLEETTMANQQKPDSTGSGGFSAALVAADGARYELTGEHTLGRSEEADITIVHPKISRKHARFQLTGQLLTVEDLGSANGTRVNQRRIEGVVVLGDGDVLSFDAVDLTVALSGVVEENDATVVSYVDDATVVGAWSDSALEKLAETPSQAKPEQAKAEPARIAEPAAPTPRPKDVPAVEPAVDLPGAWVDQAIGEHTQVLAPAEAAAVERADAGVKPEGASDIPHIFIILKSGSQQILELEPGGGEQADVWEIGRHASCQIAIAEDSVSARHAQLIHSNGKWKLVNLVSTNGIYVNGKKRLSAYLSDGDEIKLGMATIIFRTGAASDTTASGGSTDRKVFVVALSLGAFVAAIGLWWLLR
jgi:pSer/pThr/pTyr-binding forkhead associated (FHA) protein